MSRLSLWLALSLAVLCGRGSLVLAGQNVDARWIWFDAGNPAESAPAGKVWFRKEYKADEPSTGQATIACDDEFTLWVNGQKIGSGKGVKVFRFSLSGIVERGTNVFAVEAVNRSGRAGLLLDAEIRGQGGRQIPCDTGADWKATRNEPRGDAWRNPRFDDKTWTPVKVLGTHEESPWKELSFATGELDRFQVAEGFELRQIADKELVGSLIAMTWGNRGRLIVSREMGPILNVIDSDGDGNYDTVSEYTDKLKNCQGLCMVFDDLYAVGIGPEGTALYRLPDADHNDVADEVIAVVKQKGGIGEHGPHDVALGPDGWLYHNLGNHAWIQNPPEPGTPCRNYKEDYLLEPAYEDANGHAVGIPAPGGTVWRFTPDGKKWWAETVGFRNEYDIAFNQQGDLFTFDSDMEWDVNLPWYKPVRVNHCIPGAEFGWRSGAKNLPEWYFDCLPGTIDVGRGSPTGIVFYEHSQFPEKYRGALLNCDWSMGRIIVGFMKRQGASYTGVSENLVTGNPLNVSDIEVDRDGSVVFCTGGRRTEGGIYRITHIEGAKTTARTPRAETLEDALNLPQPQAAWSREMLAALKTKLGGAWVAGLSAKVLTGTPAEKVRALTLLTQHGPRPDAQLLLAAVADGDAQVRQFATLLLGDHPTPATAAALTKLLDDRDPVVQRRACEAFVRTGLEAPAAPLVRLLASGDRWLRFAARLPLERLPVETWRDLVLTHADINVQLSGMLALNRQSPETLPVKSALERLAPLLEKTLPGPANLDVRRMLQLVLIRDKADNPDTAALKRQIGATLLRQFIAATGQSQDGKAFALPIVRETAELIAWLNVPGAASALLHGLDASKDNSTETHYALCARYVRDGWTQEDKRRLLSWYETTRDWEGGNSLQGYLRNILTGCLERFTPEDRRMFILAWKERPHAARLVLSASSPEQVQNFDQVITSVLAEIEKEPAGGGRDMAAITIDVLGKSDSAQAQALLRKLFDENADRRDLLARALARHPAAANVPYLLRGATSGDKTTVQLCLEAINKSGYAPQKPEEIRSVILAGLRLGADGGKAAAGLLQKWMGAGEGRVENVAATLAGAQKWFVEKYPDEPAPELAREDTDRTKYTVSQLVDFLEKDPRGAKGDVARGRLVFAKANCIKCHRYLKEGEGVGPDLTTLRRRFQKKEIVEAVLLPSQVISDQYAAVTVETVDGLVHTGMPLPNPGSQNLLLLLSDATRLEIPKEKIDVKAKARISVMPEGLFKDLSLDEIADLFAFLETSKNNAEPAAKATASAQGGGN